MVKLGIRITGPTLEVVKTKIQLEGKVALITGGSRGIGRGSALAMADAGADVVINYHSRRDAADEVVELIEAKGRRALAVQADVADRTQVEQMVQTSLDTFGKIDVLLSNAVTSTRQTFLETDLDALQRTMDVGFYGMFHVCQTVARQMVQQGNGGSIIVVGSPHALYPLKMAFDYNIAKVAVHHMAMIMANELTEHRIRVNLLVPGWIDTPGERKWVPDEELQRQGAMLPWGRLGTPQDVGNVATFLASDAAEYVSGSTYHVDGALSVSMPSGGSSRARE